MSTPTFFHLYRDTHLSTTMVYTVACDEASPRSPCFPSYFMAHFSRVNHDNSNKKLKVPTNLAQPPSPSLSQSHSKHVSFIGWLTTSFILWLLFVSNLGHCLLLLHKHIQDHLLYMLNHMNPGMTPLLFMATVMMSRASWEPGAHPCHSLLHPWCPRADSYWVAPKHLFGKEGEERLFLTMSFPIIFKKSGQWFIAITEAWFLTRHSLGCLQVLGDSHLQAEMGQKHHLFTQMFVHVGFLYEINHQSYVFCEIIMQ